MINPEAAFDATFLVRSLAQRFGDCVDGEVHTFAYLAYVLGLARTPSNNWGYGFIATESATPFSHAISEATDGLVARGILFDDGRRLTADNRADPVLAQWRKLPGRAERQRLLDVAVAGAEYLSLPSAVRGVLREPQLAHAGRVGGTRMLPDQAGLRELAEELDEVDEVLDELGTAEPGSAKPDRLIPRSLLWLSYLANELDGENDAPGEALAEAQES